jgi:hypothetical protein
MHETDFRAGLNDAALEVFNRVDRLCQDLEQGAETRFRRNREWKLKEAVYKFTGGFRSLTRIYLENGDIRLENMYLNFPLPLPSRATKYLRDNLRIPGGTMIETESGNGYFPTRMDGLFIIVKSMGKEVGVPHLYGIKADTGLARR